VLLDIFFLMYYYICVRPLDNLNLNYICYATIFFDPNKHCYICLVERLVLSLRVSNSLQLLFIFLY